MSQRTDEEIRALDKEWEFTSTGKWHLQGRGDVYTTQCPIRCFSFDWLIGKTVKIDEKDFKVLGVERYAKIGPIGKGEAIGILVHSMNY